MSSKSYEHCVHFNSIKLEPACFFYPKRQIIEKSQNEVVSGKLSISSLCAEVFTNLHLYTLVLW